MLNLGIKKGNNGGMMMPKNSLNPCAKLTTTTNPGFRILVADRMKFKATYGKLRARNLERFLPTDDSSRRTPLIPCYGRKRYVDADLKTFTSEIPKATASLGVSQDVDFREAVKQAKQLSKDPRPLRNSDQFKIFIDFVHATNSLVEYRIEALEYPLRQPLPQVAFGCATASCHPHHILDTRPGWHSWPRPAPAPTSLRSG